MKTSMVMPIRARRAVGACGWGRAVGCRRGRWGGGGLKGFIVVSPLSLRLRDMAPVANLPRLIGNRPMQGGIVGDDNERDQRL